MAPSDQLPAVLWVSPGLALRPVAVSCPWPLQEGLASGLPVRQLCSWAAGLVSFPAPFPSSLLERTWRLSFFRGQPRSCVSPISLPHLGWPPLLWMPLDSGSPVPGTTGSNRRWITASASRPVADGVLAKSVAHCGCQRCCPAGVLKRNRDIYVFGKTSGFFQLEVNQKFPFSLILA